MSNYNEIPFHGYKIILNRQLSTPIPEEINRTWKERLFSWPWRPFKKTKIIIRYEPIKTIYSDGNKLIMHPEVFRVFREEYLKSKDVHTD